MKNLVALITALLLTLTLTSAFAGQDNPVDYKVIKGNCLAGIAKYFGKSEVAWKELYGLNKGKPDVGKPFQKDGLWIVLIKEGMTISIPKEWVPGKKEKEDVVLEKVEDLSQYEDNDSANTDLLNEIVNERVASDAEVKGNFFSPLWLLVIPLALFLGVFGTKKGRDTVVKTAVELNERRKDNLILKAIAHDPAAGVPYHDGGATTPQLIIDETRTFVAENLCNDVRLLPANLEIIKVEEGIVTGDVTVWSRNRRDETKVEHHSSTANGQTCFRVTFRFPKGYEVTKEVEKLLEKGKEEGTWITYTMAACLNPIRMHGDAMTLRPGTWRPKNRLGSNDVDLSGVIQVIEPFSSIVERKGLFIEQTDAGYVFYKAIIGDSGEKGGNEIVMAQFDVPIEKVAAIRELLAMHIPVRPANLNDDSPFATPAPVA